MFHVKRGVLIFWLFFASIVFVRLYHHKNLTQYIVFTYYITQYVVMRLYFVCGAQKV